MHDMSTGLEQWSTVLAAARPWRPRTRRMLVVVPHPDDEALLFGGLIASAARSGTTVDVIAVTDGDGAYPDRVAGDVLADIRRSEQRAAADALGIDGSKITRMGVTDGAVTAHEDELVETIDAHVREHDVDLVVAPWEHDHHADHEACGRAALEVASRRRLPRAAGLFWALLRERPPLAITLCAIELSTDELDRKRRAIECHVSQLSELVSDQPVLGVAELAVTEWQREHYIVSTP